MRTVRIEGVGVFAFPESVDAEEVWQAAGRSNRKAPEDTSHWVHIRLSDGRRFLIHPEDVLEAHKRDLAASGKGFEVIKRTA